ncbi:putative Flagellar capping protein FliD [Nitrospira sp. KM1]|uniref:flagellar filament capping protein FliD n=1 Tax=Nitrospira sp. KM1 TaxID=1936990 RepID=UPI0013A71E21|nr:flagellar filament capping protein FliD [Nitrospira sp. KM1]BCA54770.1 putative Flagellar capping protein FliD [Nitrospira sp. KM1]
MAGISFGGLGNGIDFGQVVDQLVQASRLPVDRLNEKKTNLNNKLTDLTTLGGKLIALQSAADALRLPTSYDRTTASVGDPTVLSVTASSTAIAGTYSVKVLQLAQSNQITNKATKAVASETTDIVSGSTATFTFKVGTGSNQTVTLEATETMSDLRSKINDLGAGVTASLVNTGTEAAPAYRLVLNATTSGSAGAITIVADGTDLDFGNTTGTGGTDVLQAAQNAKVVIGDPALNPITIERTSNSISDAINGVTLALTKTTGADPVQISVTQDSTAVKNNIKALATAYNEIVKFINERSTYDVTTKKGGIFFNEPTARTVLSKLRTALGAGVEGATIYGSVGQVGFKTERDGTITVDDGQLGTAISTNYTAVKALFSNQGTLKGLAQALVSAVDTLDDSASGSLSVRKTGLTSEISRVSDDIARQEDRLSAYEERLKAQFASLDALLRQIQSQTNSLQGLSSTSST